MCGSCQEIGSTSAQRTAIDELPAAPSQRTLALFSPLLLTDRRAARRPRNRHEPRSFRRCYEIIVAKALPSYVDRAYTASNK